MLPAVASTRVDPGPIFPSRSAASIIERPMRSLIDPPGFCDSSFRRSVHGPVSKERTPQHRRVADQIQNSVLNNHGPPCQSALLHFNGLVADVELDAIRPNCQTFIASRLNRAMDETNSCSAVRVTFSFSLSMLFRNWGSISHASNFTKISFYSPTFSNGSKEAT